MKTIYITTIPHNDQRYETVGDYWADDEWDEFDITVSDMKNEDFEFLVAIHEMVEQYLCERMGIPEKKILAFDIQFEKKRKKGNVDEPGDDPKAPYRHEHSMATAVERMVAGYLGINWKDYEKKCNSMKQHGK